ncbi:hypothetical protein EDC01DRAFT_390140 [Geopyxis carbonaria]|nr:hypothetical protein EDC01DRAFT_390140 [Geopyxis carbonaria]
MQILKSSRGHAIFFVYSFALSNTCIAYGGNQCIDGTTGHQPTNSCFVGPRLWMVFTTAGSTDPTGIGYIIRDLRGIKYKPGTACRTCVRY